MSEQGWLIESRVGGSPVWLKVCSGPPRAIAMTTDASKAVRFARQVDGEAMLRILQPLLGQGDWAVTGHEWVDAPAPTQHSGQNVQQLHGLLVEANDVLRSAAEIAKRNGGATNWEAWKSRLNAVLTKQHAMMFPAAKFASECGIVLPPGGA